MGKFDLLDKETGEIIDGGNIASFITVKQKEQLDRITEKKKVAEYNKELGGFIFSIFNKSEEYLKDLTQAEVTRTIFLATHLGYQGYLMENKKTPMTKDVLKRLLKLQKTAFNELYAKLLKLKIILEQEDKIFLNKDLFLKGRNDLLPLQRKKDLDYIRLYIESIQHIYNQCTPKTHKMLGLIFKLIPYCNFEWNVLCFDTEEVVIKNINYMSLKDMAKTLGYYDNRHITELLNNLYKLRTKDNKKIINFIYERDIDKMRGFINPNVLYRGNNYKNVEILGSF